MASGCGNSRVRPATAVARAAAVAVRDPWLVAPQESSWQAFGMGGTHTWGSSCWLGRNTYGSVSSVSREDIGTKSLRNFLVTESGPGIGIDYLKLLVLETLQLALIFFFFWPHTQLACLLIALNVSLQGVYRPPNLFMSIVSFHPDLGENSPDCISF